LTAEEKKIVAKTVGDKERAAHPDASVSVKVGDEVGPDGKVPVNIVRQTITVMPKGWTPAQLPQPKRKR